MYSGSRRYRGVRYVTQYVPIDSNSGSSSNIQSNKSVTITSNGTMTVQPDSGYDAMSQVSLTTNISPSPIIIKSVTPNTSSEPPQAEIIPLRQFYHLLGEHQVTVPYYSTILVYDVLASSFCIKVNTSQSSITQRLSGDNYYYLFDESSRGRIALLDENNQKVLAFDDTNTNDNEYCYIEINTQFIYPDFSS